MYGKRFANSTHSAAQVPCLTHVWPTTGELVLLSTLLHDCSCHMWTYTHMPPCHITLASIHAYLCVCNQCDDHPLYQVYAPSQVDMAYIGQATLHEPMNLAKPGHDECTHTPHMQICACMPHILRCDGKKSNFCVHTCDFRSETAPVCSFHCTRRSGRLMHALAHIDATELTCPSHTHA